MLDRQEELGALFALGVPMLRLHYFDELTGMCSCKKDCGKNTAKHPKELDRYGTPVWKVLKSAKTLTKCNIAIQCGPIVVVVDVDPRNGGVEALAALEAKHGPLPQTWRVATGGGGWHYYFRSPRPDYPSHAIVARAVDVKGFGGYVVGPCSIHASGREYEWDIAPHECELAPLPEWIIAMEANQSTVAKPSELGTEDCLYSEEEIVDALMSIPIESANREAWTRIGMALQAHGFDADVWDRWSSQSPLYRGRKSLDRIWKSFGKKAGVTIGTVIHLAQDNGWEPKRSERWELNPTKECEPTNIPPELKSEDGGDSQIDIRNSLVERDSIGVISHTEKPIASDNEVDFPPGAIGVLAKAIDDSALYSHKRFAIASAKQIVAGLSQGMYCSPVKDGYLSSYVLLVAGAAAGKEHFSSRVSRVIRTIQSRIMMGVPQSPQALHSSLFEYRSRCVVHDEGINWVSNLCDSKNPIDVATGSTILNMWSMSAGGVLEGLVTKKKEDCSSEIENPYFSFLGCGTNEKLETLLRKSRAFVEGGLISRLDIVQSGYSESRRFLDVQDFALDKDLERALRVMSRQGCQDDPTGIALHIDPTQRKALDEFLLPKQRRQVRWENLAVYDQWEAVRQEWGKRTRSDSLSASIWNRASEKVLRDACHCAVLDRPVDPILTLAYLDWAVSWQESLSGATARLVAEKVDQSEEELVADAILKALARFGGEGKPVTMGMIRKNYRAVRKDKRVTDAAIASLQQAGVIGKTTGKANAKGTASMSLSLARPTP